MNKTDLYEKEADTYARERLISEACWNDIVNNFPLNDNIIVEIGHKYNINPAILLGRVCFEMDDYARKTNIDKRLR